jgi:hypothetical protein
METLLGRGQDLNISALCNPKLRARVAIAQHDSTDSITADRMNRFLAHGHCQTSQTVHALPVLLGETEIPEMLGMMCQFVQS